MTWTSAGDTHMLISGGLSGGWKSWSLDVFKYQVMPQNHLGKRDLIFDITWLLWTAPYRSYCLRHHIPWTLAFFFRLLPAHILWSISASLSLLFAYCFFFSFFMAILLKEKLAFMSDFRKERLQRAALYLGHMFIRGNGLNSWLRQSSSLLALQKKSAPLFSFP